MPHALSYRTPSAEPAPAWLTSRAAAVAVIAATAGVVAVALCGANLAQMLVIAALDGGTAAVWIGGAVGVGDALGRACGVRAAGPLRVATAGGLGLGLFSLAGLGLGLLGWLNRPVAVAMPAVGYALAVWRVRRSVGGWGWEAIRHWLRRPAGPMWVWTIPTAMLTASGVAACLLPGALWKPLDPHPYDVTSYHLQVPREWFEAGRIRRLDHNMFSCFPMNAEVQSLLLMHVDGGPWAGMYAAQWMSVGETLLMLLAVAGAVGERTTVGPAVAAAVASAVPWVVMLGGVAYVEAMVLLDTALAVAWTLRATESGETSPIAALAVAGVSAGLAAGTKITAVPMLIAAVPVAVVAARALPWRRLVLGTATFGVAATLALSPWLVRTLAWTGNPVWPVGMAALGRDGFSPGQVERFRLAHSPRPDQRPAAARGAILWRDVLAHWEYGYVLLPAAAVAAALRGRDRQTHVLLVFTAVAVLVWIGFTHLLPRFLVVVIPVAAVAVGRATAGRLWWAGVAVAGACAVTAAAGVWSPLTEWSATDHGRLAFGLTDFGQIIAEAPALDEAMHAGRQVALVGDAQAFFYQVPMSRLHYRTVFDLPADGSADPVAAWAGRSAVGNADWLLVVNPAEVDRLRQTYYATPPLPADWAARGPETFLLRGNQWGRKPNNQDPKPNQ